MWQHAAQHERCRCTLGRGAHPQVDLVRHQAGDEGGPEGEVFAEAEQQMAQELWLSVRRLSPLQARHAST